MTVSFTVERYIAVCHPIRGKVLCTETRAKRVIATVSIICILATASTTFEYQLTNTEVCIQQYCDNKMANATVKSHDEEMVSNRSEIEEDTLGNAVASFSNRKEMILDLNKTQIEDDTIEEINSFNSLLNEIDNETKRVGVSAQLNCTEIVSDTGQNCSDTKRTNCTRRYVPTCPTNIITEDLSDCCISKYIIKTEPTQLGRNATYRTIFYWFSSVTFAFLPLILIATINCFLVNAVRKSQKERKKMTKSQVFSFNACY